MGLDEKIRLKALTAQKTEITEHLIYERLARSAKKAHNKEILSSIARDELEHYNFWKSHTLQDVKPSMFQVLIYTIISKIWGITFGIKLMERGEGRAQVTYRDISLFFPDVRPIIEDEDEHEKELVDLIDEERLKYIGSIVLGLNDALVELTGALAGFTLALQNTRLIAMTGFITGFAASLSMAASEYLSIKAEDGSQNPLKASAYTGSAYVATVLFLIFPYLFFSSYYFCLGFMLLNAVVVILFFTFYVSITKEVPFGKRFIEMAGLSFGIAFLSFVVGYLLREFMNVDI